MSQLLDDTARREVVYRQCDKGRRRAGRRSQGERRFRTGKAGTPGQDGGRCCQATPQVEEIQAQVRGIPYYENRKKKKSPQPKAYAGWGVGIGSRPAEG